jgi:hypothetical protein
MAVFGDSRIYLMHVAPEPFNVVTYRGSNRGNVTNDAGKLSASFHTIISVQACAETYFNNKNLALLCGDVIFIGYSNAGEETYSIEMVRQFGST